MPSTKDNTCFAIINAKQVEQLWHRDRTTQHDVKGRGHFEAKL